ncbi:bacteriohemerythrin [Oceanobacter mangrovi]|uniref:bacteriohemerythrin n=1 Tax=Oceanobacter mangrovi TaxID=2862510 RepID=UPI001C8E0521|nr:hemerythrin domain-containing protein [Oceanobacter mangrovi]
MLDAKQLRDAFEKDYQLGLPQLDKIHEEFVTLLLETINSSADAFIRNFQRLFEHTQLHFFEEEARMAAFEFAGFAEHSADHALLLQVLEQMNEAVAKGETDTAKAWLNEQLPEWFDRHTRTMDSAAADWVGAHAVG